MIGENVKEYVEENGQVVKKTYPTRSLGEKSKK